MINKLTGLGTMLAALLWATEALASCPWWGPPCGGTAVPEIDGTAGIMALALAASVAALLHNRSRK